jgi:putative phosphoserine phosphatase/1-acylglycerol-3-phosphate O-acyltransferase
MARDVDPLGSVAPSADPTAGAPAGGDAAAIFDLDRTLLSGASGPIISEALRHVGLLTTPSGPIESLAFGIFNLIGETWPSMFLTRQGARAARGWSVDLVREAADRAAGPLAESVLPYAQRMIDEHREAGRTLVLATTTPVDLVRPMAEALGFEEVIATRYGRRAGHYDGTIDGPFVWGKGKARAVAEWAHRRRIDLDASYAYSDSYYDVPLLSIVGHPRAVNPDPRMLALATLRRWPVVHFDVPAGVPKFAGLEPQRALLMLAQPQLFPWMRLDIEGADLVPRHGPAVLVANHRSYIDPIAIGFLLARVGRPVRFLGKKEVFDAPLVGDVVTALGGIRVDRGTGSDEPLRAAQDALAAGELVAIMPQGTIPRGPAFFEPTLKGRWGAVRLAEAAEAPIIPIGLWGTEQVWPRSAKFPDVTNLLHPPTVRVRVGDAVQLKHRSVDADTKRVMKAISALLPAEARERHEPTEEELARTYPGGVIPDDVDAEHEATRRPGTD